MFSVTLWQSFVVYPLDVGKTYVYYCIVASYSIRKQRPAKIRFYISILYSLALMFITVAGELEKAIDAAVQDTATAL